jgi:hypothetical protein
MDNKEKELRGEITSRDMIPMTWSIKKIPLTPGYWCVCVGPLRSEWGDYAGKIFLAKAEIVYYPGTPPT